MDNNNDECAQVDQNGRRFWTGPDGQKNYANADQPCPFYMRGNCAYGESCRKSHDQNLINQTFQKREDKWWGKGGHSKNGKGSGKGNWNSKGGKGKGKGNSSNKGGKGKGKPPPPPPPPP